MSNIIKEYSEYRLDTYPKRCKDCPFLDSYGYRDNAYQGIAYTCKLGYMAHGDTREFDIFRKRWPACDIENNQKVYI